MCWLPGPASFSRPSGSSWSFSWDRTVLLAVVQVLNATQWPNLTFLWQRAEQGMLLHVRLHLIGICPTHSSGLAALSRLWGKLSGKSVCFSLEALEKQNYHTFPTFGTHIKYLAAVFFSIWLPTNWIIGVVCSGQVLKRYLFSLLRAKITSPKTV